MRYHRYTCASLLVLFVAATHTIADDQASNRVYVKSGHYGQCYAKAVPAEDYGSKGETRIYAVGDKVDRLVETYPWYAQQIDLQNTIWGISVVRIAPVRRGQKPDENDLAIGFYLSGKTLKEYSTLDMSRIENDPGTVWSYFGILKVNGYRWIRSNDYAFDVETGNGKTHSFDVRTGALLASESRLAVPMLKDDGWSPVMNGLQSRLILVEKDKINGTRWLVPNLELRNVRDMANQMEVNCDFHHLRVELVDAKGEPIRHGSSMIRSGPAPELNTVVLPWHSSITLSLENNAWAIPPNAPAMVAADSGAWVIEDTEKGNVFLRVTLTDEPIKPSFNSWKRWYGTIQTPLLKVDWK